MVIRLLVTGGRAYADRETLERTLEAIHRKHAIEVLIHGDCPAGGADKLADDWAKEVRIPVSAFPVDHDLDGPWPFAGPRRNRRMIANARPTHCVAFPDPTSKGTWDAVRQFNASPSSRFPAWVI